MTREEHLLVILGEECVEVVKEVSKALRFGLNDKEPGQNKTNRERITDEFNDVFAVVKMLIDEGILKNEELLTTHSLETKIQKVEHYLKYSKSVNK